MGSEVAYAVDSANEQEWNQIVRLFRDATLNQTWAYCTVMAKKASHLVVRRGDTIVAGASLRLVVLPLANAGIAYLSSGPMWRRRGEADDLEVLRQTLHALKEEYVVRRRLLLRITPNVFTNLNQHPAIRRVFGEEGFYCRPIEHQTLLLDLQPSLGDLRKALDQKWRNILNRAERSDLTIREGVEPGLFATFRDIYDDMRDRKKYKTDVSLDAHEVIQNALPPDLKMRIVIAESQGRPMAGGVFSTIGDTGYYVLGATSTEGMKNAASYLVQWRAVALLKEAGLHTYDLGGCSPKKVATTYHFKAGICGKRPEVASRIGILEACDSLASKLAVRSGEFLKSAATMG